MPALQQDLLTELTIRRADANDVDVLREIGVATYRDHFAHVWSEAGIRRFVEADFSTEAISASLADPDKHVWLLASDADSRIVGYAKLNWDTRDPIHGQLGAELQKIYFRKSETGKGYGAALRDHVFDLVRQRSGQRVWLDVLKINVGAQRFYEQSGFVRLGEMPFKTDLAEVGMVVMALEQGHLKQ